MVGYVRFVSLSGSALLSSTTRTQASIATTGARLSRSVIISAHSPRPRAHVECRHSGCMRQTAYASWSLRFFRSGEMCTGDLSSLILFWGFEGLLGYGYVKILCFPWFWNVWPSPHLTRAASFVSFVTLTSDARLLDFEERKPLVWSQSVTLAHACIRVSAPLIRC